jgi:flagellum-specific peptidoglycan hydrolase FlgJ
VNINQWWFAQKMLKEAYKSKVITGLPASILAAQSILETGWGKYIPVDIDTGKFSYNLFGIKGEGTNGFVRCFTHEFINNKEVRVIARFRAYNNYSESFVDYGNLIWKNPRYQEAVKYENRIDPQKYINEICKAGYSTDKCYPSKVIAIAKQCGFIPK